MSVAKTYPFNVGFPGVELVVAFPEIRRSSSVMEKKTTRAIVIDLPLVVILCHEIYTLDNRNSCYKI